MSVEDDLHRLRHAWRYAEPDARRRFWIERLKEQGISGESEILMTSQVNSRDGSPAVLLQWGEHVLQLDSQPAKQHAMAILETAMAADLDAFLMYWLQTVIGAEPEKAAAVLIEFRQWREAEAQRRATKGDDA